MSRNKRSSNKTFVIDKRHNGKIEIEWKEKTQQEIEQRVENDFYYFSNNLAKLLNKSYQNLKSRSTSQVLVVYDKLRYLALLDRQEIMYSIL